MSDASGAAADAKVVHLFSPRACLIFLKMTELAKQYPQLLLLILQETDDSLSVEDDNVPFHPVQVVLQGLVFGPRR